MPKPRYEDVRRVCQMCGKEITGPFGTYRFGLQNGMICYDCDAKVTEENRRRRQAINAKRMEREDPIGTRIKKMYDEGYKPSKIASVVGVDTRTVYEKLEELLLHGRINKQNSAARGN